MSLCVLACVRKCDPVVYIAVYGDNRRSRELARKKTGFNQLVYLMPCLSFFLMPVEEATEKMYLMPVESSDCGRYTKKGI